MITEQQLLDIGFRKEPYEPETDNFNPDDNTTYYLQCTLIDGVLDFICDSDKTEKVELFPFEETYSDIEQIQKIIKAFRDDL